MKKISIAPLDADYKINKVYKILKDQNRESYNLSINSKTNEEIKILTEKIDTKERRELYDEDLVEERRKNKLLQQKKYYEILLKRENQSDDEKLLNIEKSFEIDYKDPRTIIKLKKAYYSNSRYYDFIEVKRKFAESSKTFFSYIGLMDAMEVAYNKHQANNEVLVDAINIGYDLLNNWSLIDQDYVEVIVKMIKIMLLQSDFSKAEELMITTMNKIKVKSLSANNKLIMFYAKVFMAQGNFEKAKRILLIGLNKMDKETIETYIKEDNSLQLVFNLAQNKGDQTFENNTSLYYMLYTCYVNLQDLAKSNETIIKLQQNNPEDQFVLKRL